MWVIIEAMCVPLRDGCCLLYVQPIVWNINSLFFPFNWYTKSNMKTRRLKRMINEQLKTQPSTDRRSHTHMAYSVWYSWNQSSRKAADWFVSLRILFKIWTTFSIYCWCNHNTFFSIHFFSEMNERLLFGTFFSSSSSLDPFMFVYALLLKLFIADASIFIIFVRDSLKFIYEQAFESRRCFSARNGHESKVKFCNAIVIISHWFPVDEGEIVFPSQTTIKFYNFTSFFEPNFKGNDTTRILKPIRSYEELGPFKGI